MIASAGLVQSRSTIEPRADPARRPSTSAGLGAQPLLGVVDVGGGARVQAVDGDVALVVVQAWRSAGPSRSARRARGRPTCRSARRGSSVRTSTSQPTRPRRLVVRAGTPMSQLPESAITITSAREQSLVLVEQRRRAVGADLLLALDEHHDADRQVVAVRPDRGQVGGDAGLVVGGAAAVEAAVALGRLERRRVPVGVVVLGLHVVVGVEQHRRRALAGAGLWAITAGAPPSAVMICTSSKPSAANSSAAASALRCTSPARAGSALTDSIRTRASRSADAGQDVAHRGAELVRVLRHGAPYGRGPTGRRSSAGGSVDGERGAGGRGRRARPTPGAGRRASAAAQSRSPVAERDPGRRRRSRPRPAGCRACAGCPASTCTAAYGGTRTSTELPGALASSRARKCLVSSRRSSPVRVAGPEPDQRGTDDGGVGGAETDGHDRQYPPRRRHGNHRRVIHEQLRQLLLQLVIL